jgi:hypothetical protein
MLRRLSLSALAGLALLAGGGCAPTSNVSGPQLKDVPADFGLDRSARSRRIVLEDRELLDRLGYFLRGDEGTASIILTEFAGPISKSELEELQADRAERWARSGVVFSDLEELWIDNTPAWIWYERGARSRRLVGVVPYPDLDRVWTVDFYTSVSRLQDEEMMLRHVASFALDPQAEQRAPVTFFFFCFFAACGAIIWYLRRGRQYRVVRRM